MKYISIFLIMLLTSCYGKKSKKTGMEGKILPSFSLLLSDSTTYFNTKNIPEGKPIVLYYYDPNCPYCRAQMEEIIENINLLKDIQFYVLTSYPYHEMKSFYNDYQLEKFSNITAGMDYANFFESYFRVKRIPYIAIYGKNKRLIQTFLGQMNSNDIMSSAQK